MTGKAAITVRDLMEESGVAFGTSGARGLVSAMTDRVCYGYTAGFLSYLRETDNFATGGEVALAGDLRPSTPRILRACAQAIRDAGGVPVFCGHVPTPALALHSFHRRIPSLMVTGSHIPDDRNGIKFHRPTGEVLKSDEAGIARQGLRLDASRFTSEGALAEFAPLPQVSSVEGGYIRRNVDFFGADALGGLTVGVYQHSAVGRDLLARILEAVGAKVVLLGRSETFIPVDTEALRPEDIKLAHEWAATMRLDAIVSTDGDSDRPLLADHRGEWLRGDVLGLLCARELGAACVVTPVSSTTAIERSDAFARVIRSRIGSPYVIAAMTEAARDGAGPVCGFEANGGFLLESPVHRGGRELAPLPTRDAVLPLLAVLAYLAKGGPAERLARVALHFWPLAGAPSRTDDTDGLRMTFSNGAIIHLRPSGNAPELRCYTEADDEETAHRLNAAALRLARDELTRAARKAASP